MRKISFLLLLLSIGCSKEQTAPSKGSATFSTSQISRASGGGRISSTPSFVLLSIEDNNGKSILENKKLSLFAFGQGYESESIELVEGNYKLTRFQILNSHDTVIYATPLKGSALADYVTNPLPISFTVVRNANTLVAPQVLAVTSADTPGNFGYVNFGFDIVAIRGKRIKEILVDAPSSQYHIYYSYNSFRDASPSKEVTYYYNVNTWALLDSSAIKYDSFGRVSRISTTQILSGYGETYINYTYDNNGRLSKMSNYNGSNYWDFDFFYDQSGKLSSGHQSLSGNSWYNYLYEYSVNDLGDVDTVFIYAGASNINKILRYKRIYQYDNHTAVIPTIQDPAAIGMLDYPVGQKHNILYQREIVYNLNGGTNELVIVSDCSASNSFQYYPDGKPRSSVVSNPDVCVLAYEDQTKVTYIYE